MKSIRLTLTETDRTDLMCVVCGFFGTQFAAQAPDVPEPQVGIHKHCVKATAHKRTRKGGPKPVAPPAD